MARAPVPAAGATEVCAHCGLPEDLFQSLPRAGGVISVCRLCAAVDRLPIVYEVALLGEDERAALCAQLDEINAYLERHRATPEDVARASQRARTGQASEVAAASSDGDFLPDLWEAGLTGDMRMR